MTAIKALCLALAAGLSGGLAAPAPVAADVAGPYLAARQAARTNDFAEATRYFLRALAEDPSNTGLMDRLVLSHVGTGAYAEAVPVARRMLSSGAVTPTAMMVLLTDMLKRRDYEQVLADIADDRLVGPLVDGLVRAWSELGAGRVAQSLAAFDELSRTPGLQTFGDYHKALALASVGDFEGADALLSAQEGGFAQTRRGVFAHAAILSQIERNAKALEVLEALFGNGSDPELDAIRDALRDGEVLPFLTVRDAEDGLAEVFFTVATALRGEADDTQTLIYARSAEFLRPDHADALLTSAGLLEQLGQYDLAIAAYARIEADSPAFVTAQSGRAQALFGAERQAEAVEVMQALAGSHPAAFGVHVGLGDMLRRMERYVEAAEAYTRAVGLLGTPGPRHWFLFYSRAIAYERAKVWDRAEPDFRKALELSPDQPSVLNYLGYSFLEMGSNIEEAMEMIESAVAQRPDDGYIIDSLAWGYFLLGRYDEALEPMERASLLMPVDPIVTDHLGDVYWAVGRQLEARFQWRRALSFDPEGEDAERIRRKLEIGLDAVLAEEGAVPLADRGP